MGLRHPAQAGEGRKFSLSGGGGGSVGRAWSGKQPTEQDACVGEVATSSLQPAGSGEAWVWGASVWALSRPARALAAASRSGSWQKLSLVHSVFLGHGAGP